jgi:hypothetical protein
VATSDLGVTKKQSHNLIFAERSFAYLPSCRASKILHLPHAADSSPFRSTCGGAFRCRWSDRQAYLAPSLFVRWQPGRRSKKPFARIGAVVAMRVEDYYPKGKRWWVRLHEKGGKRHEMPAHHTLEAYLDSYIEAAGIRDGGKAPLFRSAVGRTGALASETGDTPQRTTSNDRQAGT